MFYNILAIKKLLCFPPRSVS